MKKHNSKKELLLLPLLLVAILVPVGGHWLMQPSLADVAWVEYSLAALPLILVIVVIWAFKLAVKNDDSTE